jgi:hypothetical protein
MMATAVKRKRKKSCGRIGRDGGHNGYGASKLRETQKGRPLRFVSHVIVY